MFACKHKMDILAKRPNLLFIVAVRGTVPEKANEKGARVSDDLMAKVKLKLFNGDRKNYHGSTKEVIKAARTSYKYYNTTTCLYYRLVRIGMLKEWHFRRKLVTSITVKTDKAFGLIKSTAYTINGKLHRESFDDTFPGPAHVMSDAKTSCIEWYYCGKLHRDAFDVNRTNLPAKIIYNHQFNSTIESWYVHGLLHRTDGPAEVACHDGKIIDHPSIYSVNGNRVKCS